MRASRDFDSLPCPLITFVSASGGCGKSTLALLSAHATAHAGIETALLEGDLQFGDMGFWLGLDDTLPSLSQGPDCSPITISNHLDLFKAPSLPEVAEDAADNTAHLMPAIRCSYDLVIADTGQFWSGLTGELVCNSNLIVLLMDQREASIYGAIKALELLERLGVAAARIACVLNRATSKTKSELERIRAALACEHLITLPDGKAAVESMVSTGRIDEFVETGAAPVPDIESALAELLPRIGLAFNAEPRKKSRRLFS